jgi:hypothetical protein
LSQDLSESSVEIRTARGSYKLTAIGPAEELNDGILLTFAFEHSTGLERMGFRVRISRELVDAKVSALQIGARLAPWIEREFEQTREAALKAIRAERALLQINFDRSEPGPFAERS